MRDDVCNAIACVAEIEAERVERVVTATWLGITTVILSLAFLILLFRFIKHFPGTLMSRASLGLLFSYTSVTLLRWLLAVRGAPSLAFPYNVIYILLNIAFSTYFLWALVVIWIIPWCRVWWWSARLRFAKWQHKRRQ